MSGAFEFCHFRVEVIWSSFWRGVIPLDVETLGNSSKVPSSNGGNIAISKQDHGNDDDIVDEDVEDDMEIDEDVMDDDEEEEEDESCSSDVRKKMSQLVQIPQVTICPNGEPPRQSPIT